MAPRRGSNQPHQNGLLFANFLDMGYNIGMDIMRPRNTTKCACPLECLRESSLGGLNIDCSIHLDDLRDTVRVICNNEQCPIGQYMHRECFEHWEQTILNYLRSVGRARSWSERQRHQNLWTKKGYDLAYKVCSCKCGRGHLKKDLDWVCPNEGQKKFEEKKKKKKNGLGQQVGRVAYSPDARIRAASLSSSNGSSSPVEGHLEGGLASPAHSGGSINSNGISSSSNNNNNNNESAKRKIGKWEFFSDRIRNGSAGNGIFNRRLDFSAFNKLPRGKLNSYQIKMEDEGNHGNDETRCFILSTLAGLHMSQVTCVLCDSIMPVFDRYPLVDGTFFLSPRQHSKGCVEVKLEGRTQFLSAVCMTCLEGWGVGRRLRCLYCATPWEGSTLILGTLYNYDIFAAMPCCTERLRCNNCQKPLLQPNQRLNFYSDYSHSLSCPHCQAVDTHFVKPLGLCYTKDSLSMQDP